MIKGLGRICRMAGVAVLAVAMAGGAQAWEPSKPVEFVIMAGQGGGADKMARLMQAIAEEEDYSPQPLVPVNKPGGSGAEALVHLKGVSDPDHTIMVTLNSFFTTPLRQPGLEVDILTFAPVGRMAEDTFLLWVHKEAGINTFEEFLAAAKERGNDWVMGGTGSNQEDQIITDALNSNFGLDMKYIPYKGGGAVAKDLAGQQITSSVNNPSEALGFWEAGDVVALVSFTDERLPMFPDVPTLKEFGHDFAYTMQRAVVGAPGMSAEAQAFYTDMFGTLFQSAQWQKYRTDKSMGGEYLAGEDLLDYWQTQRARHEEMLKASGAL